MDFPEPVIAVAIEPKTKADQEKLGDGAAASWSQEDPTFRVHTDDETGQTLISGMGELHLEIIVDRMMREFNVEANVGKPQVAYRRRSRTTAEGEGTVHPPDRRPRPVRPRQDPASSRSEPGPGIRVRERDRRRRRSRRSTSQPSRRASTRRWSSGILAGYPMVGRQGRRSYDGSYHDVDSSEMAFKIAGSMAFKEACQEGQARCCSSRSWTSRSWCPRSTWATSSAT